MRQKDKCDIKIEPEHIRQLAQAHCEVWKGNAIAADPYNLRRSLELYSGMNDIQCT